MNSSILMLAIIIGISGLLQAIMDIIKYRTSLRGVRVSVVLYVISSILSWYGILANSNIIAGLGILIFFGNKLLCLYLLKKEK